MKRVASLLLLASLGFCAEQIDPATGMKIAEGWETVRDNCTVCHSAKMYTMTTGTRQDWITAIKWMQETQGLWEFDPETEKTILDYLSKEYAPKNTSRRRPLLASDLLPPK